jgi:hypothetical protein
MTLRVTVPTSYIHERYLGRPSCPKCGELLMAPEYSECLSRNDVRHAWVCDKCDYGFQTLINLSDYELASPGRARDATARLFGSRSDLWRTASAADPDLVFGVLQ